MFHTYFSVINECPKFSKMPNPENKVKKKSITEKLVEHVRKDVVLQIDIPPKESGRSVQCRK